MTDAKMAQKAMTRYIQTVNGRIPAESLGITIPHEHILLDYRCVWSSPRPDLAFLTEEKVTLSTAKQIRCNAHHSRDNLRLDDERTAIEELMFFHNAGGNAVVEQTTFGLSPDPLRLQSISKKCNLDLMHLWVEVGPNLWTTNRQK